MCLRPLLCLICMFMMVNIADAAPFAYITDAQTDAVNKLSVIDTATNTLVKAVNIAGGTAMLPYGVAINPAGTRVYISNQKSGSESITVVDSSTPDNNIIATISRTKRPGALAVNPAGSRLFVANENDNTISVLDITTDALTEITGSPVSLGINNAATYNNDYPGGFAIKPGADNNTYTLYVTSEYTGDVCVFDVSGDLYSRRASDIVVGGRPLGIAYANSKLYVADSQGNTVSVVNTGSNGVTTVNDPSSSIYLPIAVVANSAGTQVYVSNSLYNSISVIDTSNSPNPNSDKVTSIFTDPSINAPYGIALNPLNTALYVSNNGVGSGTTVTSYATGTGALLGTINIQKNPWNFGNFIGPMMRTFSTSVTPSGTGTITPNGGTASAGGQFYVLDGSQPRINFTGAPGFSVNAVTLDGTTNLGAVTSYTFPGPVTADHSFSATFTQTGGQVTVTKSGVGTGTVTSNISTYPTQITCGTHCSDYFPAASTVTLTAVADAPYSFGGWTNCPSAVGNVCTISNLASGSSTTIDAAFVSGGPIKVMGTGAYPLSIQAAYDSLTASDTISIIAGYAGTETLDFSKTSPVLIVELRAGATDITHAAWNGASTIGHSLNIGGNTTVNIQNQSINIQ